MRLTKALIMMFCLGIPLLADSAQSLTARERDTLRFKLENLYNEMDLLIRNHRTDASDLKRQEREFGQLKVFERIPFAEDSLGLKRSLEETAQEQGIKISSIRVLSKSSAPKRVPSQVFTDTPFKLSGDQLVEEIRFKVQVKGEELRIKNWVSSWTSDQLRIAEAEKTKDAIQKRAEGQYEIVGRAFRFRPVKFPRLVPRDPLDLLPQWAQKNPQRFAREEPLLWSYVTRTRELKPRALPFYSTREEFLLNGARMDFFLSKALSGHG